MAGTIKIEKLNLMGYTPETQMWFVSNRGGRETAKFLGKQIQLGTFDLVRHMGRTELGLRGDKAANFREFAQAVGFNVEMAA